MQICNTQQNRTNPILLSVAYNKFKTTTKIVPLNTWQDAFHGSIRRRKERQVHWRIQSCGTLPLGCFQAWLSPRGGAKLWDVTECGGYPWIWGQFNDRWAFKDLRWRISCFSLTLCLWITGYGQEFQNVYQRIFFWEKICIIWITLHF